MIDREILARLDARAASGDDLSAAAAAAIRRGSRSGRPTRDDHQALVEMETLLAEGSARTVGHAAQLVALTLVDEHSLEGATARLARKFIANKKLMLRDDGEGAAVASNGLVGG